MSEQNSQILTHLRDQIARRFDLEELQALAFDLEIDWDELPGRTKTARIQSLLIHLAQRQRLAHLADLLNEKLVKQLMTLVATADDMTLSRLRPYAFADQWGIPRREVLALFLLATREGMLTLQWDVLCPFCRGAQQSHEHLAEIESSVHCASCQIDFRVNFNQSVELTFAPNENIRPVERLEYCIAGPEVTPHIVSQQLLPPNSSRLVSPILEKGRYRCRTLSLPGGQYLQVTADGLAEVVLSADDGGWLRSYNWQPPPVYTWKIVPAKNN